MNDKTSLISNYMILDIKKSKLSNKQKQNLIQRITLNYNY